MVIPIESATLSADPDPLGAFIMFSFIRIVLGSCSGGRHYYVKINGQWTASICGASQ